MREGERRFSRYKNSLRTTRESIKRIVRKRAPCWKAGPDN